MELKVNLSNEFELNNKTYKEVALFSYSFNTYKVHEFLTEELNKCKDKGLEYSFKLHGVNNLNDYLKAIENNEEKEKLEKDKKDLIATVYEQYVKEFGFNLQEFMDILIEYELIGVPLSTGGFYKLTKVDKSVFYSNLSIEDAKNIAVTYLVNFFK